jgi:HPr kinase/phosphorylase
MSSAPSDSDILHASAVAIDGQGVILLGPSGSGKSSLAARLIEAYDAALIGDDRLKLSRQGEQILARPHEALRGLIEMRGLGLVRRPYIEEATLSLAVALVAREVVPRMAAADYFSHAGARIARLHLHAHDSATPLIIHTALQTLGAMAAKNNGFSNHGIYEI